MIISEEQINQLRSLGFKFRNKSRYSYLTSFNQLFTINVMANGFQLEIDGSRIYSHELSFSDLIKILKILYPNEIRKRI